MSDATPMLAFVGAVMQGLGPYFVTGLALAVGGPLMLLLLRIVRTGLRGWPML